MERHVPGKADVDARECLGGRGTDSSPIAILSHRFCRETPDSLLSEKNRPERVGPAPVETECDDQLAAAAPAWATAMSSSTDEPDTPIAPMMTPFLSLISSPPPKITRPSLVTSMP